MDNKKEYIDRGALLTVIETLFHATDPCGEEQFGYLKAHRIVREAPAADVTPVVHGRWVDNGIPGSMLSKCTVCGYDCGAYTFKCCPMCGAVMDATDTDVDNKPDDYVDYGNVSINSISEYKLNPAYTEILRLHEMLEQNGIPHEFRRLYDGWQVRYPGGDRWRISAVQHYGSCGATDNLIEIMGIITLEEHMTDDAVLGHLTAEDVYARIVKMHSRRTAHDTAEHCIVCGEVIPEGRQVCPGCEKGDDGVQPI